jgi:hypothetical protein
MVGVLAVKLEKALIIHSPEETQRDLVSDDELNNILTV